MSGRKKDEHAAGKPGSQKKEAAPAASRTSAEETIPSDPKSSEQEKRRRKAAKPTNDALHESIEKVRTLLAETDEKDVVNRYEIAVRFCELRDGGKYGKGVVPKVAAKLGLGEATVHDYANVAETWPDAKKFSKLAAKKGEHGRPLSWSHFVELTREENGTQRRSLMTKALKEGWSVPELKAARQSKDPKKPKKSAKTGKSQSQSSCTSTTGIEKASTNLAQLTSSAAGFHKEIEKVDQGELAATRERLEKDRQAASKLVETYAQCIEQIDLRLEQKDDEQQPDASPANPKEKQTDAA